MKIEKKKVTGNSQLSKATKISVASLLGMTSVYMSACVSDAESGAPMSPVEPDSTGSTTEASSSSAIDIPLSHEHLSSSVEEALSSSAAKISSSSNEPPISAGVPLISSPSSESSESSSSVKDESSSSSSIIETPISSSEAIESSSQTDESSSSIQVPSSSSRDIPFKNQCEIQDSTGIRVIMCHDDDWGMMASMVSTYEMSDMT